jgi:hypothetical protein
MPLFQSNRLSPDLEGAGDHTRGRGDVALPHPDHPYRLPLHILDDLRPWAVTGIRSVPTYAGVTEGGHPVLSGGLTGSTGIGDNWIPLSAFRIIATNEDAASGSNSVPARSSM